MRIATIQTPFGPRAAVQAGDDFVDLHGSAPSLPANVRQLLEMEPAERAAAVDSVVQKKDAVRYDAAKVTFHAPVIDPRKIVCIGLNYKDHAEESGAAIPKEPVLFSKYATAL